jgi:Tfp pilus assembly protein FimT
VAFIVACILGIMAAIAVPSVIKLFREEQKSEHIENSNANTTAVETSQSE